MWSWFVGWGGWRDGERRGEDVFGGHDDGDDDDGNENQRGVCTCVLTVMCVCVCMSVSLHMLYFV